MFYGIKDNNVWDICSKLVNKRKADDGIHLTVEELDEIEYFELSLSNVVIGDTWDFENSINIPDSPLRDIIPEKSKIELLQEKVSDLEARIENLESQLQSTKKL